VCECVCLAYPAATFMPARITGCLMPNSFVNGVVMLTE
jgi:hypothetical protein